MNVLLHLYYKYILIIIFLVGVFCLSQYLAFFLLVVILTFYLFQIFKIRLVLFLSILLFLLLPASISDEYRNFINIFVSLILLITFLHEDKQKSLVSNSFPREINIFLIFFTISLLLSALLSDDVIQSLIVTGRQLLFILIVFLFYSLIKSGKDIIIIAYALFFVSICLGIVIFYQIFVEGFAFISIESENFHQFGTFYSHPNAVGLLLAVSIPFSISLFYAQSIRSKYNKIFMSIAFMFLIIVLLLTNSRASIISVVISLSYILFKLKPKIFFYGLSFLFIISISIVISENLNNLFGLYFRVTRIFENTRFAIWDMSLQMISVNPIFGVGPGLFETKIYKYLPVMLGSFEEYQIWWAKSGTAHNLFLYKLSETGLVGLFTIIYFFYSVFKISYQVKKKFQNDNGLFYVIPVIVLGTTIGLLSRSLLESTGFLTNGWITRDLPYWLCLISIFYLRKNYTIRDFK